MNRPITFFDLETSSKDPQTCQITQLSAVVFEGSKEIDTFDTRVKFDVEKADPEALKMQGYTEELWRDALPLEQAIKKFSQFLNKYKWIELISTKSGKPYKVAQLAGYNAAIFDGPILRRAFEETGAFLPAAMQILDVYQLMLWLYEKYPEERPESTKLGAVCEAHGIPLEKAHDSLHDTRATGLLAHKILSKGISAALLVPDEKYR